jgi:hypothetical protein
MDSFDSLDLLECPICLSSMCTDDKYTTWCCKQQLHNTCYEECMKFKAECPLCRTLQLLVVINQQESSNNIPDNIPNNITSSICNGLFNRWGTPVFGCFIIYLFITSVTHYSNQK